MTIYEKIKSVCDDKDQLAKVLYILMNDDIDICNYCQDPSGTWCADIYCVNAMKRVLTELEYKDA